MFQTTTFIFLQVSNLLFSHFHPIFLDHPFKNFTASTDIRIRWGAYKHFVALDDDQIVLLVEAITTYPHLWNACEQFSECFKLGGWKNVLLFFVNVDFLFLLKIHLVAYAILTRLITSIFEFFVLRL